MNSYSVLISLILRMTIITGCTLLIKTVFKSKLSPKVHTAVWLIPCVQFLFCIFGVKIQNSASIYNVVPNVNSVTAATKSFGIKDAVIWIWIIGSAVVALWYLISFINYRRRIKLYPLSDDSTTDNMVSKVRAVLDIPKHERITVRYGDTAQTMPHVVILPEGFSACETYHIILHELCHYRHKDYIKLWIGLGIVCLNWFNPLMWYAFKVFRTDLEMLCDDRVLKLCHDKKEYARVLVKSATVRSHFVPGAASVHNGRNEVIKRVKRIADIKKNKPIWLFICGFMCVTACCVCLTDAVSIAVENTMDIVNTPKPVATVQPEYKAEPPKETPYVDNSSYDYPNAVKKSDTKTPEVSNDITPTQTKQDDTPTETLPQEEQPTNENEVVSDNRKEGEVAIPEIGVDRNEVYSSMGEPEVVGGGGTKEVYQLNDGSTAILQYDGDTLEQGYIVE